MYMKKHVLISRCWIYDICSGCSTCCWDIFNTLLHLLVFCKCWSSRIVKSLFKYGWWCGHNLISVKVEKILKGSLDSIPSPSSLVKIQIMGGKVCWRCKGKTLLGNVKKLLKTKCWHHPTVFFLITSSKLSHQ